MNVVQRESNWSKPTVTPLKEASRRQFVPVVFDWRLWRIQSAWSTITRVHDGNWIGTYSNAKCYKKRARLSPGSRTSCKLDDQLISKLSSVTGNVGVTSKVTVPFAPGPPAAVPVTATQY